jgi:hypothetical protein
LVSTCLGFTGLPQGWVFSQGERVQIFELRELIRIEHLKEKAIEGAWLHEVEVVTVSTFAGIDPQEVASARILLQGLLQEISMFQVTETAHHFAVIYNIIVLAAVNIREKLVHILPGRPIFSES